MDFFGRDYELKTFPIDELVQMVEYDKDVQRSLKNAKVSKTSRYIINAIKNGDGVYFSPIMLNRRSGSPLIEDYVVWSVVDGQHRIEGMRMALISTRRKLTDLSDIMNGDNSKHILRQYFKRDQVEKDIVRIERDETKRIYDALMKAEVPVMMFLDLPIEEEKQMFHDINTFADKIPKSLSIDRDNKNLYNILAKEVAKNELVAPYLVSNLHKSTIRGTKLFTLKSIRYSVTRFVGSKRLSKLNYEDEKQGVLDAFRIFIESLPNDYEDDKKYFYHHSNLIEAVMRFANEMRSAPGVDWRVTLKDALEKIKFELRNKNFAKIGGALVTEDGTVVFRGTAVALNAMYRTLFELSDRLNEEGKDVVSAYGQNTTEVEELSDPIIRELTKEEQFKYDFLKRVLEEQESPLILKHVNSIVSDHFYNQKEIREYLEMMVAKGDAEVILHNGSKKYGKPA